MSSQVIRFWVFGDASHSDDARETEMPGDRARTAKSSLIVKMLGGDMMACILSRGMRTSYARRRDVCLDLLSSTQRHTRVI